MTDLEEWDFASTALKYAIWRNYMSSIMNNMIFILIQLEMAFNMSFLGDDPLSNFNQANEESVSYECREDFVAV